MLTPTHVSVQLSVVLGNGELCRGSLEGQHRVGGWGVPGGGGGTKIERTFRPSMSLSVPADVSTVKVSSAGTEGRGIGSHELSD